MDIAGPEILTPAWPEYSLLDSGGRRKLERFGDTVLIRGEPKAWWRAGEASDWRQAVAEIKDAGGNWRLRGKAAPDRQWGLSYGNIRLEARLTDRSKHVGVFPEQEPHWRWLDERLRRRRRTQVLNLFGYTGAASLVAAAAGAEVTHVDASKPALSWARHNQALSGLEDAPIRWLLDDAFKFVAREIRRGRRYDGILLDPPSFGRGPKGEIWKVENQLGPLIGNLARLLRPGGLLVLTLYNLEASSLMLSNLLRDHLEGGRLQFGELALREDSKDRFLPLSLYARWDGENGKD